jgi:hypothetical protein
LKNRGDVSKYLKIKNPSQVYKSVGAVQLVYEILKKFGVHKALVGSKLEGKLALYQELSIRLLFIDNPQHITTSIIRLLKKVSLVDKSKYSGCILKYY